MCADPRTLSVVIPTYNRVDRLRRVLDALETQQDSGRFEVVVVSDGSTDGTDELLASRAGSVVGVSQSNAGAAQARNTGIEVASGDIVLFIDDDLVPSPELVAHHRSAHAATGDDAVVIGPMLDPPDHQFTPWTAWEQRMLEKQYDAMRAGLWSATARQFYTANASVGRELLTSVGGFDPTFKRMEDVELAYRLDDVGVRWTFEPRAVGYHYAERSFESWRSIGYAYGRNDVIFGRDQGRPNVLRTISAEYRGRNLLLRAILGATLRFDSASDLTRRSAELLATSRWALRAPRLVRAALSCTYNDAYYRGVADELGGLTRFRDLVGSGP